MRTIVVHSVKSAYGATIALALAWLLVATFRFFQRALFLQGDYYPTLPLVSLPFDPRRDVVSSIPALFGVLTLVIVALLVIEVGKFVVFRRTDETLVYVPLLFAQGVLAVDAFRAYAYDWWLWCLSWLGVVALVESPDLQTVSGHRVPWFSGVVFAATSAWIHLRPRRPFSALDDDLRNR